MAAALARRDTAAMQAVCASPIFPHGDNFVERPWGGSLLTAFKSVSSAPEGPIGESFEISAWRGDREAEKFASRVRLPDGSEITLSALLDHAGAELCGPAFADAFPEGFPLLPKLLDIKELLSIQGHPPGNTEVYVIIDADPGATIRLGFNQSIDREGTADFLKQGLKTQKAFIEDLAGQVDLLQLHADLAPWFARRENGLEGLPDYVLHGPEARLGFAQELRNLYWRVLDLTNEIEVQPGQVIFNCTPDRFLSGEAASAEVHALGNPERREVLALEIRKPGVTFRAWDNVRFPMREVDVDAALGALNLEATSPADFLCPRASDPNHPGWERSVDGDDFVLHHAAAGSVGVEKIEHPHCLHLLAGSATLSVGSRTWELVRGGTVIIPVSLPSYGLELSDSAELVRVIPKLP